MEPNLKIVNGYKVLTTFVKNSMIDVYQGPKYSSSGNATSQLTLTCSKSTIETPGKSVKYVQINYENTRATSSTSFLLLALNIFRSFSSVSIVDFEQVNVS